MDLVAAINEFSKTLVTGISYAIGLALAFSIIAVVVKDFLRKRAEEQRRIWRKL